MNTTTLPRPQARERAVSCGHLFTEAAGPDLAGRQCPIPTWHPSGFCQLHRQLVGQVERRTGSRVHRAEARSAYREGRRAGLPRVSINGRTPLTYGGYVR